MRKTKHGYTVYESPSELGNRAYMSGLLDLARHEGYRDTPYRDSRGNWTIGFGSKLGGAGMSEEQALDMARSRYTSVASDAPSWLKKAEFGVDMALKHFHASLQVGNYLAELGIDANPVQREVLHNMAYNMGMDNLKGFRRMFEKLGQGDVDGAAQEIERSKYGEQQAPERASELASMMRNSVG